MDRNCDKCMRHTTGSCSKWTCEFKSVEMEPLQIKGKMLEKFRDTAREICHREYPDLERRVEAMTIVNLTYDKLMSEIYPQGYNPYQE